MRDLFNSLGYFLSTLELMDIIFFASTLLLIILLVTMYYIIKINTTTDDDDNEKHLVEDKKEIIEEVIQETDLAEDILNACSLPKATDEPDELLDLETITKAIEYGQTQNIDISAYEDEQEQKAIISYDELLQKHDAVRLNYKKEKDDGVSVKEIDLSNLTSKTINKEADITISQVTVISYDKEEAFLEALKNLKNKLT